MQLILKSAIDHHFALIAIIITTISPVVVKSPLQNVTICQFTLLPPLNRNLTRYTPGERRGYIK